MTAEQHATPNGSPRAVSPGRPPKSAVAARLRHILAVASAEFVSRGYAEASVSRIAADAGVSKKTIYARYPSKEALLLAVTDELAARLHERVIAAMADSAGDPEHALTSFGIQVARIWLGAEEIGLYRLMIYEAVRFPRLASVYRETMTRFRGTLAVYLREQAELGTLAITDPDAASHQFGMLAYGDVREKALLGETVTDEDITTVVRRAVHLFLNGYAASPKVGQPG
ncbi:TetR/AcrR family transcriptional regulator [Arthrobacter sp. ISL-69]|uniref:TetR/AcrR family transcriptional regulator n=1 Tax=Arthrobacter sp. ISL-69 TaxID=2819113 RepID=UPI001BEA9F5F|nr:TetR/AcrR family transcriptional regulator [Arthrobacter sp. ISL-69]MBT2539011.1 TetR/AcrR family transcriptional regulator [Arthrobacter sp. ISL-69]